MNRKGLDLAISTLILLIIGIFVLIGIIYFVTGGFTKLKGTTDPFLDSNQALTIKTVCQNSCDHQDLLTYCCEQFELKEEKITCSDSRLAIDCSLSCAGVTCPATQ